MLALIFIIVALFVLLQISKLIKRVDQLEREIESIQGKKPPTNQPAVKTAATATISTPAAATTTETGWQQRKQQKEPRPPSKPSWTQAFYKKLFAMGQQLLSGNIIAKLGGLIFIVGMAFLLKYAAQFGLMPIWLRLLAAGIAAIVILSIGWLLRTRNATYALIMQGTGISLIYIVIFVSFRLYHLVPASMAFALLILVGVFAAILSILQDSRALIVIAQIGGFLAPILASTGEGSYIALFTYYAILNSAIAVIAWFKSWRLLNLIGFLFTFIIATVWGVLQYSPVMYLPVQGFLIYFILLYVLIALWFARGTQDRLGRYVDGTLVFGVPLVGFALQLAIVRDYPYGAAFSSLAFAAFYLVICWLVSLRGQMQKLLTESFLAIAVIFITLAIPLGLSNQWTGLTWAIEGALITWIGCKQQRLLYRSFGFSLSLIAGLIYLLLEYHRYGTLSLLIHGNVIGIANLACCYFLQCQNASQRRWERLISYFIFVIGALCIYVSSMNYFDYWSMNYLLLYLSVAALLASLIASKLQWKHLQYLALGIIVHAYYHQAIIQISSYEVFHLTFPIAWAVCFATIFFLLYQTERSGWAKKALPALHAFSVWLLVWWTGSYTFQLLNHYFVLAVSWEYATMAILPILITWFILAKGSERIWPISTNKSVYRHSISIINLVALGLWSVFSNIHSNGTMSPLDYLPVVNPIDLITIGILFAAYAWLTKSTQWIRDSDRVPVYLPQIMVALLALFWITCMVLRSVHQWADIPYNYDAMYNSTVAQAAVSIAWVICGLVLMIMAYLKQHRAIWIVGGCLLVLVVAKLMLVDLSHSHSLARIISFITVGAIMLVIGYIAPLPPKQAQLREKQHEK